jgi:hypothetical protein
LNPAIRAVVGALLILVSAKAAHAECINVRNSGAVGNGIKDGTAAIQAAIESAISARRGRTVCLPGGDYLVKSTIVVDHVQSIQLIGEGGATRLIWRGEDRSPLLRLSSVQDAEVRDFHHRHNIN